MRGRFKKIKLPQTYMGFPVHSNSRPDVKLGLRKKGIAMVTAIMIIAVLMMFVADILISSQVNLQLNAANRDNVKAEYMALSALNIGTMLLTADFAYDLMMMQQQPGAKEQDGMGDFWSLLNEMPIGGETLEMLEMFRESFSLGKVLDSGILEQLRQFDGTFVVNVFDESSKININMCARGRCIETKAMLEALFSCPAERTFLDKKDLTPKQLVARIVDWVDSNNKPTEGATYNEEDEIYEERRPKTRTKNAPFDSVDELRQIEGWDEDIHAAFSPYLTVFPYSKSNADKSTININTVNRSLMWCLFPEARNDECAQKSTLSLKERNTDKTNLTDGKKVGEILAESFCYSGGGDDSAKNRNSWFTQKSTVFRIEARGIVGDQEKVLRVVVERTMPTDPKNDMSTAKVLYWSFM